MDEIKICINCNRKFKPSSKHKACPACRSKARYNECSCNNKKHWKARVCKNCQGLEQSGMNNPKWSGGKYEHSGYINVYVGNGKYVREHRLIMEKHLGRKLLKDENVHHINGIRNDNRIENLELWCKPQPTGVRARQVYEWAKEIVARYEGIDI